MPPTPKVGRFDPREHAMAITDKFGQLAQPCTAMVKLFAAGKSEVTFAEWTACVAGSEALAPTKECKREAAE
jgi:hypothetical protein